MSNQASKKEINNEFKILQRKILLRTTGRILCVTAILLAVYVIFLRGHIADTVVGLGNRFLYHDYEQALEYLIPAAEQGYAMGQNNLGWMYENGYGVKKDIKQAKYWYEKAAAQGNENAKNALKRLNGN